ncbi:hypothetical protein FB45DRAFT_1063334 [Roridomyces roridus]|uniref:NAD(P)-binding protein n=1 Tax=Roridomyces roridus TaxID=1738132 RepID=A0AAD7BEI1_9AGAR|nr:hypothetical protein FB45DRAFT_1063334 [Roridomyces roridus]
MKKIFFLGGTGYVGGPILSTFFERQRDNPDLDITVLVRSSVKVEKLRALNLRLNVVHGSHEDADLVERLAADADVVFSLADSDYLPAIQAVLRGLQRRFHTTGIKSVLIHMSGTGCLADDTQGTYSSIIHSDTDIAMIESLPVTQLHRHVDVTVVEADSAGVSSCLFHICAPQNKETNAGYVETYIVLPPVVYGTPKGLLFDMGVQNTGNTMLDLFIGVSTVRGAAPILGEGNNLFGHVDVTELHDFVLLFYDTVVNNPAAVKHGRHGYYFANSGDISLYKVTEVLESRVGPRRAFTQEELAGMDHYHAQAMLFFARNWRSRADKARALGWKPMKTAEDFLEAVKTWKL